MAGAKRTKVFVSHADEDAMWLERLQVYLKPMERNGSIDRWDKTRVGGGDHVRDAVEASLDSAAVAVVLVSSYFLASDFIDKVELPRLLRRARSGGVRILPVIVDACMIDCSELASFKSVNNPTKPLKAMSPAEQDEVLLRVAHACLKIDPARWALGPLACLSLALFLPAAGPGIVPGQICFSRAINELGGWLPPYCIERTEVTNADFVAWLNTRRQKLVVHNRLILDQHDTMLAGLFIEFGEHIAYRDGTFILVREESRQKPVTHVSWYGAQAYCHDHGRRLPAEAEWLQAARGRDRQRLYPWGDSKPSCATMVFARLGALDCGRDRHGIGPVDVDAPTADQTPDGVLHLGGNVAEWVDSASPGDPPDPRVHVYRGADFARGRAEGWLERRLVMGDEARANVGFRCAFSWDAPGRQ